MKPLLVGCRWDAKLSLSQAYPDGVGAGLSAERVLGEIAEELFSEGPLKGRLCLATKVEVVKRGASLAVGTPICFACIVRAIRADESAIGSLETVRVGVAVGLATQPEPMTWLLTGAVEVQVCEAVTISGRADGVADGVFPTFRTK